MKYKMFVCDLDGTLLNSKHQISQENINAIKKLDDKGIKFVVATGRTKYFLEDYLETVDNRMPFIWSDGAVISDPSGKDLSVVKIPPQTAKEVILLLDDFDLDCILHTTEGLVANGPSYRIKGLENYNKHAKEEFKIPIEVDPLLYDHLDKHEILKISISGSDIDELGRFQSQVNANIKDLGAVFSADVLLDITAPEATKGNAVLKLAKMYDIKPEEIVAIGDNENDISMLSISGLPITLENAIDSVKAVAKEITKDHNLNGVAHAIERFVL